MSTSAASLAYSTLRRWDWTEPLRGNIERAVELARKVLEGDETGELHYGILVEEFSQIRHQLIAHVSVGESDSLCILQSYPFPMVEDIAAVPGAERSNLLVGACPLGERM